MLNQSVTVNSLKYNGKIHRSWQTELIKKSSEMISVKGVFGAEVSHPSLGVIRHGTVSYEYFFLKHWFNIFCFFEPEGELRNFYCNISQPPEFSAGCLNFVDFDIDVVVWKDFSKEILDMDEFEQNALLYNYPKEIKDKCLQSLNELLGLIDKRLFPFNFG